MFWQDQGVLVTCQPFSNDHFLLGFLTQNNGLAKGLVRTRHTGWVLGACADIQWQGTSDQSLGVFDVGSAYGPVPLLMDRPIVLRTVHMMCILCAALLPQRVPMPFVYGSFLYTLTVLSTEKGLIAYNDFENVLLQELGYGQCPSNTCGKVIDMLRARRVVFSKHWPDHGYLRRQRDTFVADISTIMTRQRTQCA